MIATTRMSSKGQIVIPEDIRKGLGLDAGTEFVVLAQEDVIILRAIAPPTVDGFNVQIAAARKAARRAGLKRSHVSDAVAKVRARRRNDRDAT